MTTSGNAARDGRGKLREPHPRSTPTIPLSNLRAAAAASAPSSVQLFDSIQSRPLQANPAHPLLWNSSTVSGSAARQHRNGSVSSSTSTPCSSARSQAEAPPRSERGSSSNELNDRRGSTTAHVLQLHRPEQNNRLNKSSPASMRGQQTEVGTRAPPAKKVAAVNYNALFQQQEHGQQPQQLQEAPYSGSQGSPSPEPPRGLRADSSNGDKGDLYTTRQTLPSLLDGGALTGQGSNGGAVEGPLPPEVRRLIAQSCPDSTTMEGAEQQARRLISTGRRVKVYREELAAAEEERRDWAASTEQRGIVRSVLQSEVDDINARIQALVQERAICEAQLRAEDDAAAREARKLAEADERVAVLRTTIDGIVEETTVPRLMLQQLVPSLLIENYI